MENQLFTLGNGIWKRLIFKGDKFYVTDSELKSVEKFNAKIEKSGMMTTVQSFPISSMKKINYNEADEMVIVRYMNEKGKEKKLRFTFSDAKYTSQFGEDLGKKLNLTKSTVTEKQWKPMLGNLFLVVVAIGATIWLGGMDDTSGLMENTTRRNRGGAAIIKMVVDTVGSTGVYIIGSLLSLFGIYNLYTRYKNPKQDVSFS